MNTHTIVDSPLGELTVVADDAHIVGVYFRTTGTARTPRLSVPAATMEPPTSASS